MATEYQAHDHHRDIAYWRNSCAECEAIATKPAPLRVLSLGGGTQSCALALMSAAGDLPKLDHIIFADTQGEVPGTYEYLEYLRSVVEPAGIPLHIVTAGNLERALLGDLTSPCDRCDGVGTVTVVDTDALDMPETVPPSHSSARPCPRCDGTGRRRMTANPTPPAHLLTPRGEKGRLSSYKCSYDFKRRQVERKVKQLCGGRGAWKRANVEQWIGFSVDEMNRMKQSDDCRCGHKSAGRDRAGKYHKIHTADGCTRCDCKKFEQWQVNRWPLIELRMRRENTIRWFGENGHPTPPRSACWFCPNSSNARWSDLKRNHPDLFERACAIDESIRDIDDFKRGGGAVLEGTPFLHESLVSLRDADLRTEYQVRADNGELALFDPEALGGDCDAGVCFT